MDLDPIPGTLDVTWEYTLDGPSHTHKFIPRGNLLVNPSMFWDVGGNSRAHMKDIYRNSTQRVI